MSDARDLNDLKASERTAAIGRPAEGDPALRDAQAIADRIAADVRDADALRERLRSLGQPSIPADGDLRQHLVPGEVVHALRRSAILSRPGSDDDREIGGTLYLTSERVVHLGQVPMSVQLTDIVETSVAGERLLLSLHDGNGLVVDCSGPRAFRTQLADAIRGTRR